MPRLLRNAYRPTQAAGIEATAEISAATLNAIGKHGAKAQTHGPETVEFGQGDLALDALDGYHLRPARPATDR